MLAIFFIFANGQSNLQSGLVAWYPFDGNASDMSGNGNHGTVNGATLGIDRNGRANRAYSFDGVNDYIELESLKGDNFRFAFSNVTLSAWIKTTRSIGTIFGKTLSSWVAPGKAILVYNGYLYYDQCGTGGRIANAPLINDGNWYQVVTVLNNQNNVEFYVDGVIRGNSERNTENWIEDASTHNLYIGTKGNMLFDGNIDDIRLYNRAFSAAEVLALYNQEKPKIPLTDSNFQTGVNLWFSDEAHATATYGHISDWNVSAVTSMYAAFKDRTLFNEDISAWDVSKVRNMERMFDHASSFDQDIGDWNVSSVTNMHDMFKGTQKFNHSIAQWDTSSVTRMSYMFADSNFNQPIGDWNTSAVVKMTGMFRNTKKFNQNISDWNVSSVETMHMMFDGAYSFNQPLDDWNLSSARVLTWMFKEAESFNQNIASWNVLPDVDLRGIFIRAPQFNQDISGLGISSDSNLTWMLDDTSSLSDDNKGKIHTAFSFNPTWPYDWSEFITDSNQSDPPTDNNQTQPTSPDNNQSKTKPSFPDHNGPKPEVPADHNATQPPVVDKNQTTIPPVKDSNQTTIDPPNPELIVLAPMVVTYGHQRDGNGTITLHGKIKSDGNGTIEQNGFNIRTSLDGNDTVLLADNLSDDDSFSITVSSIDSFYFQAFASNEEGETKGTWKRVVAKSLILSSPIRGSVETGDGWLASDWFGDFRYFENGWAYHFGLGWVYVSADREDGIWLWRKEHGWIWTAERAWPYLWQHNGANWLYHLRGSGQQGLFYDFTTGRYAE